ncbi:helix-turn-helix domain-containing protein [uncultured Sphingomonas sp.]|uniref:helix-turn-helix domain-containing protein n=1 Tax=uncultured Sphingomonas sp. TaxID=158754 RepID=UPI0035CC5D0A
MMRPHIQRRFRTITDSSVLEAFGTSLRTIREEDRATNADLARVLGRSKATIERYIAGDRAMPATTLVRGCQEWDGRLADRAFALAGMRIVPIESVEGTDGQALADLCDLAAQLAEALQDGIVTDDERARMAPTVRHVVAELGRLHRLSCTRLFAPDTS